MVRVLLVDDDVKVRAAVRVMLDGMDFEITEAGDGDEALRAIRIQFVDVVLCDLFMPAKDGLELIRALRKEFPSVKVIAMSGGGFNGTVDMLRAARHLGAAELLRKPFDQAAALAAINKVVEPAPAA